MTSLPGSHFRLAGKRVLVTGASSGLGVHFARVLAAEGAHVILAARRKAELEEQAAFIRNAGGVAHTILLDVNDPGSVADGFEAIESICGGLDVLINNAGVADEPKRFLDTTESDWQRIMETNLTGAWRVARSAAAHWVALRRPGVIVNIASIYGLRSGVLKVAYNVSKAGLVQLTRSMAVELARQDIRVNALCPGWFLTAINGGYFASESGKRYINTIPMRRLGRLEDLTVPLLLLASDAGAYMTGSMLSVDGGIAESPI